MMAGSDCGADASAPLEHRTWVFVRGDMKRDLAIVRAILLLIEGRPATHREYDITGKHVSDMAGRQVSNAEVNHHLRIMQDADLLSFSEDINLRNTPALVFNVPPRITWQGHDFLEVMRNESAWSKVQEATKAAGGWTVETVKQLGVRVLSELSIGYAKSQGWIQ